MNRCHWVKENNPLYLKYHDEEWGTPSYDDNYLYEIFILETFQAGLSWECILNKREAFRKAFDNFNYQKIANYNQTKVNELINNKDIVRNKLKINASITNTKIFIDIQKEYKSFSNYIWHFTNNKIITNKSNKLVTSNNLSDEISKDLKNRGMKFVGTTTIYSYLQAIGIINDHEPSCDLYYKNKLK
jgi:DNA-3-methyladenine glycosylase I